MSDDTAPLGLAAYEQLGEGYAATIATNAFNAHYERPATMSQLSNVQGLNVLDASTELRR